MSKELIFWLLHQLPTPASKGANFKTKTINKTKNKININIICLLALVCHMTDKSKKKAFNAYMHGT